MKLLSTQSTGKTQDVKKNITKNFDEKNKDKIKIEVIQKKIYLIFFIFYFLFFTLQWCLLKKFFLLSIVCITRLREQIQV